MINFLLLVAIVIVMVITALALANIIPSAVFVVLLLVTVLGYVFLISPGAR